MITTRHTVAVAAISACCFLVLRAGAPPEAELARTPPPSDSEITCAANPENDAFRACYAPGTPAEYMQQFEAALLAEQPPAYSYSNRWTHTATDGFVSGNGTPVTLTFSFVPDYDSGNPSTSNVLFAQMDAAFGSRDAWQDLFREFFDDWSEVTGIRFVESPDDGAPWPGSAGSLGVRGDVRIVCIAIDGPYNVLAYNYFPNGGDMALDSAENWANSANDYRFMRNVIMHEFGHGLGLDHVLPRDHSKLMEAYLNTNFAGPQHDDVRGANHLYGDPREPDNTSGTAWNGGAFNSGATFDGLSLHDDDDADWIRFSAAGGQTFALRVEPVGFPYEIGPDPGTTSTVDSSAINPLRIDVYDASGTTQLRTAIATLGQSAETSPAQVPAGDSSILVRITTDGNKDDVQNYRLVLTESDTVLRTLQLSSLPINGVAIKLSPADLDGDGTLSTPNEAAYNENETVTLTAPATASGYTFLRWVIDGQHQTMGVRAVNVLMNASRTARAEYVEHVQVDAGEDLNVVAGESVQLVAAAAGGNAPYSYSWQPAVSLSDPDVANPTATPTQSTTYTVTVTDAASNVASDSVTVQVAEQLSVEVGSEKFVVANAAFTLSGTASGGAPPYRYAWDPAEQLTTPENASTTGRVDRTTAFTLTVTDAGDRIASDTVIVRVAERVTASAGENQVIGEGGSAVLTAYAGGGAPPYSYAWKPAGIAIEANGKSVRVSPAEETLYTVTVSDSLGQQATAQVLVSFAETLRATAAATPDTIAVGEFATLKAEVGGGIPPYEYAWAPAEQVSAAAAAQTAVAPTETTVYSLTVSDASGQMRTATVQVTVEAEAAPVLPAPMPSPCGFGLLSALPLMILSCISARRRDRRV